MLNVLKWVWFVMGLFFAIAQNNLTAAISCFIMAEVTSLRMSIKDITFIIALLNKDQIIEKLNETKVNQE